MKGGHFEKNVSLFDTTIASSISPCAFVCSYDAFDCYVSITSRITQNLYLKNHDGNTLIKNRYIDNIVISCTCVYLFFILTDLKDAVR